jgi:hypothetical protein
MVKQKGHLSKSYHCDCIEYSARKAL